MGLLLVKLSDPLEARLRDFVKKEHGGKFGFISYTVEDFVNEGLKRKELEKERQQEQKAQEAEIAAKP